MSVNTTSEPQEVEAGEEARLPTQIITTVAGAAFPEMPTKAPPVTAIVLLMAMGLEQATPVERR